MRSTSLLSHITALCLACTVPAASVLGQTFTRATTTFPAAGVFTPTASVAFGNGVFVGIGLKGRTSAASNTISAYTSTDGNVWTERVINIPGVGLNNHGVIRFIGGQFIFTGIANSQSYAARSADGVTWSVTNPANLSPLNGFQEIITNGDTSVGFFATTLGSSTDGGATWSARTAPGITATAPYYDAAYGAGRFVLLATGTATKVWTSTDAATWTEILAGQQNSGRIAYGNGLFVLTGTNYKTSTDGVNFTVRTPNGISLTGTNILRFINGRFIHQQFAFNSSFQLVPSVSGSTDGLNWTTFAGYAANLSALNVLDYVGGNNRLLTVGFENTGTVFSPQYTAVIAVLDTSSIPTPPSITTQPSAQNAVIGGSATFSVVVGGTGNTYQWRKDNVAIGGATSATYTLSSVSAANAGSYSVVITNSAGSTTSNSVALTLVSASDAGRIVNLAIRSQAGTGAQTLIVGLTTSGAGTSSTKALLIRGIGPKLDDFGVTGVLADPKLELYSGNTVVASNDNWEGNAQVTTIAAQVGAFALTSATSKDSALYNPALPAGGYSVQITGIGGATGVALAEIYDATPASSFTASTPRLINVSARTQVGTGGDILIAGFVIGGSTAKTVLIRAVGPTLTTFGVSGVLSDPKLELYSGSTKINENDDWSSSVGATAASVGAFALTPNSKDATLLVTLQPGSYTAQVSGVANTTGVALVEIYEVP